jgi:hypothetical protein
VSAGGQMLQSLPPLLACGPESGDIKELERPEALPIAACFVSFIAPGLAMASLEPSLPGVPLAAKVWPGNTCLRYLNCPPDQNPIFAGNFSRSTGIDNLAPFFLEPSARTVCEYTSGGPQ